MERPPEARVRHRKEERSFDCLNVSLKGSNKDCFPSQTQNATVTLTGSPESDSEFLTRELQPC